MKQLDFGSKGKSAYGGVLLRTRRGRLGGRPLSTRETMHLVLRSSKASGQWSFKRKSNEKKINHLVKKFSNKYGIKIISMANVGNHLHFHIKIGNRLTYPPFIRALTSSIAMAVTGASRWQPLEEVMQNRAQANKLERKISQQKRSDAKSISSSKGSSKRFWDYRPFTRIVRGYKALLNLRDYIQINRLEGFGYHRKDARYFIKSGAWSTDTG